MRSRAARLTLCAVAWTVLAAAAFFLVQTEQQISQRRERFRTFDQRAREAADSLADMRAAQHAYVAAGQGVAFWMPKVAALLEDVARGVDRLRVSARSAEAGSSLMEAAANVTEFGNVDRRAREYLKSGQTLMAGDVVFTEGGETAALASRQVESARLAERRTLDAAEAALRREQATVLGAAAGMGAIVMAVLAFARPRRPRDESSPASAATPGAGASLDPADDLSLRVVGQGPGLAQGRSSAKVPVVGQGPGVAQSPVAGQGPGVAQSPVAGQRPGVAVAQGPGVVAGPMAAQTPALTKGPAVGPKVPVSARASGEVPRGSVPVLKAAADLCTAFGLVKDAAELHRLLARAADVMDASGLVVWVGDAAGADLRPVLAHGYSDQVFARMPTVPRSANNAAAAAYRTGALQVVPRRPGSNGAVVAPLLSPEGCVGAFSAEILSGSETADSVQALAAIFAAQLVSVLAGSATSTAAADPASAVGH